MNKLITILIIALALYGGYEWFQHWEKTRQAEEIARQAAAAADVKPENLPGLPQKLEPTLKAAQQQGAVTLGSWLKTYGNALQDPRKAWIELDYCVAVAREDPAEGRRVFASVKERTPPSSPVWPRINQLQKVFE
jgi:hypothetical protein